MTTKFDGIAFGLALRTRRAAEHKTLRELAIELDVDISTLSRVETGNGNPNVETFLRLDSWLRGTQWHTFMRCPNCDGSGIVLKKSERGS